MITTVRMLAKIALAFSTVVITVFFALMTEVVAQPANTGLYVLALTSGFAVFAAGTTVLIWVDPPPPPPVPSAHLVARR